MPYEVSKEAHDEACVAYAALLLNDCGAEITAEKLNEVVAASGNTVEAYWAPLFASMLTKEGVDIQELILENTKVGGGGGGAAAGGDGAAEEEEEAAAEEEEEVDVGGGNLFGDDAEGY